MYWQKRGSNRVLPKSFFWLFATRARARALARAWARAWAGATATARAL